MLEKLLHQRDASLLQGARKPAHKMLKRRELINTHGRSGKPYGSDMSVSPLSWQ